VTLEPADSTPPPEPCFTVPDVIIDKSDSITSTVSNKGLCIETCAGTARLSAALNKWGVPTIAIDYDRNRHFSVVPIVKLDLTIPSQVSVLLEPIELGMVEILTSAPPCGTASRAREIPLPGRYSPKPLRSELFPWGLPNLSPEDNLRVEKANQVYDSIFVLIQAMLAQGKSVVIENPLRSLLWELPTYRSLLTEGCFDVCLQNCKFSFGEPSRAKWSRFRTNILEFKALAGPCRLSHTHLEWGIKPDGSFATADEAAYPIQLCAQMASVLVRHLENKNLGPYTFDSQPTLNTTDVHKKRRLLGFSQPRGSKLPPLIPEFAEVQVLSPGSQIDPQAKLLRYDFKGGEKDEQLAYPVVGFFWTPEQFVDQAKSVSHPLDMFESLDSHVCDAFLFNLEHSPSQVAKHRVAAIKQLIKLVHDYKDSNDALIANMSDGMKKVLGSKHLVATQKLLDKYKYEWPDLGIVNDLIKGGSLTGMKGHSGLFPFEVTLPSISVHQLRSQSDMNNKAMMSRTKSSGDPDMDLILWDQTLEEKNKGWLEGPFYDISEVTKTINDVPHLSRRFGINQSSKVRAIDDFHESNINDSFGMCDKLQLMDVDSIASTIRIIEAVVAQDVKRIKLCDGSVRDISVHVDWLHDDQLYKWQGGTLDLKSAYKQIAVANDHLWSNVIVVFDPHKQSPAIFVQNTLPFGSSSSVILFNRIARFLWFLGCVEFKTIWNNFYDDYPTISPSILSKSTKLTLETFLKLLGWHIAEDEKKGLSFSEMFTALGVVFDISDLRGLGSFVSNTEKRKAQVLHELLEVSRNKKITSKLAESLVGKLQFMEAQCFGRLGRSYLRCLRKFISTSALLEETDVKEIHALAAWLQKSEPRKISPGESGVSILFTDGACEFVGDHRQVTCGAILFPADNTPPQMFGFEIPTHICKEWAHAENKEQLVTEAELFPTLIALRVWKNHFRNTRTLIFIDSEPAKHCLIRGTSKVMTCANLVKSCYELVDEIKMFPWFSRVPSKSNPADAPSRLEFEVNIKLFSAEVVDVSPFVY
jgi:hypothetical protein